MTIKTNRKDKNKFDARDFIGFILFIAIIGAIFYAIHEKAGSTVFICLTIIAGVILLFWLSPTITELMVISKKATIKVKQGGKKK